MLIRLKKIQYFLFAVLIISIGFLSCKKDINNNQGDNTPDLATTVNASLSGFVTDENNAPVQGANVKAGLALAVTDQYGFFELKNVDVIKTAATVSVSKTGYFKATKTWRATDGKSAFFRIKLLPKTDAGTISSSSGGNVTLTSGLSIAIPANAVVNAADNSAYTGNVHVAVSWLNPESPDLLLIMPGDLRGIDESGAMKGLITYGMAAVELSNDAGELLQIASSKKATITMPLSASLSATAPATIPLWYFDESNGLWKEEGSATKSGNSYIGEVSHFSFWNYDDPATIIHLDCTIKDANGNPIPFITVKITDVNNPAITAWGFTNISGYVEGFVPINSSLKLEVFTNFDCGTPLHTQTFSTSTTDISLGNISINTSSNISTISGTATNCAGAPLTNGYVMANNNNQYFRYPVSNTGTFNFTTLLCNPYSLVSFMAEDIDAGQQGSPSNYYINPGNNAIGNLQACGVGTEQFVRYTLDGGVTYHEFNTPTDSIHAGNDPNQEVAEVWCHRIPDNGENIYMTIFNQENLWYIDSSWHFILYFGSELTPIPHTTSGNPMMHVNITEAGPSGGFISGSFSGTMTGYQVPVTYNVSCSFRIRRNF